MELRHLRYFVAVAEEENMRRAAGRLHIVQPALSRQIRQLEDEIGSALFDRLPRGVRLNAAGQVFLELAREILSRVDEALERARRVARGEAGRLCIGFIENASWFGAFPNAIQQYRVRYPNVSLDLQPMFSIDQFEAVASGKLDTGFCYTLEELPEECEVRPIRTDTVVLAVPRRYGWKKRRDVCLHELQGEAFVGLARTHASAYADRIRSTAYAGGLLPRIVQEAVNEATLLSLVSAGIGLGFCNSANERRKPPFVDFVPVVDFDLKLPLCLVWKQSNSSAALKAFREIVARYTES